MVVGREGVATVAAWVEAQAAVARAVVMEAARAVVRRAALRVVEAL